MNRNQKITVFIGVILIVISGLFPPFEGELAIQGDNPRSHLGRHFLFSPPTPEYMYGAIFGKPASKTPRKFRSRFRAKIIFPEILVQFLVILIATFGITLIMAKREA